MTGAPASCPNGHPAVRAVQRFCETCGAPVAVTPPPPSLPGGRPVGGGPGKLVGGLLALFAVVAIVAMGFVLLQPGGGPAGSPGPSASGAAVASPTPMGPTDAPTAVPTAPSTPASTPESSPEPTPAPTPEPAGSWPPAASCRNDDAGLTVVYPAAWYAYAGDARWKCLLFDPDPITVTPDSELPEVAVEILPLEETFATVVAEVENATYWTPVRAGETTIDGRPARVFEVESTGEGFFPAGLRRYEFVVDRGDRGTLVIETIGEPGPAYEADRAMVDLMAGAIEID